MLSNCLIIKFLLAWPISQTVKTLSQKAFALRWFSWTFFLFSLNFPTLFSSYLYSPNGVETRNNCECQQQFKLKCISCSFFIHLRISSFEDLRNKLSYFLCCLVFILLFVLFIQRIAARMMDACWILRDATWN